MIGTRSTAEIRYISMFDPAVDHERADHTQYMRTFDLVYRPTQAGKVCSHFRLKRLSRKRFLALGIKDVASVTIEQCTQVVAYGLKGVENFLAAGAQMTDLEILHPGTHDEQVAPESLDKLFAPELVRELATVVLLLSQLDPLVV